MYYYIVARSVKFETIAVQFVSSSGKVLDFYKKDKIPGIRIIGLSSTNTDVTEKTDNSGFDMLLKNSVYSAVSVRHKKIIPAFYK